MKIDSINKAVDTLKAIKSDTIELIGGKTLVLNSIYSSPKKEEFLGVEIDTWVAALITISTFLLGYFLSFIFTKYKEYKKLKATEDFFLLWLKMIDAPIKGQIKYYKEFIEEILKLDVMMGMSLKTTNLHIDKPLNIPINDLVSTFIYNRNGNTEKTSQLFLR